ncbi:dephospho-CoA kinase [Cytophaga aurantiaca]|uniref:dephospho-CoA kinase n=1 Tax=Cytophaga aurantiaca TaxID=29530 RepID=UPI00036B5A29|nr:dephospho-CoA kinase [Cytophaga aurantiaca]
MFKVGITGGIGTGKSTVCRIFSILGIPVYDADSRAKWLTENHPDIRKGLIAAFGSEVFKDNVLNRPYLASVAFADDSKTAALNAITHPAVRRDFNDWANAQSNAPYIIKEAALFYEADTAKEMNEMIVVTSPTSLRIERVLHRDTHRNEKQVRDIMNRQIPDAEKIELADHVIFNDEEQLLIPQILRLHEHFILRALL